MTGYKTYRWALLLMLFGIYPAFMAGQSDTPILTRLLQMGMEDVSLEERDGIWRIAYSDRAYRETSHGLFDVLNMLLDRQDTPPDEIRLLVLKERIPTLSVTLAGETVRLYRSGSLSLREVITNLQISYDTSLDAPHLRRLTAENSSAGKIDMVLYPRISLRNAWLDKLYGAAFDIAPALEIGLWKGASFTGQVIIPVWNNMVGEMDYIRAGMVVFRQEYRFPHNLFASFHIGHFNSNRMGADATLRYRPNSDRWMVSLNAGLTGSSTFYRGKWEVTTWKRLTGSAAFRYNLPLYHLQFDLTAQRYIYGDYGVRMDCSRHFGEVTIGFYAMYSGGLPNGGFHFAVPLPQKKRSTRAVRVRLPDYFDLEYEAQSGNEYASRRLGRYYETRPDENRSRAYLHPRFLKERLLYEVR
ncbi:MAG: YjbH domain-containing protein [Tannerellaceae bacterium]|jgi:hypothetical protein|nr:YjbH domain-containing protein [Tannerellaceae bacterium]